MIEHLSTDDFKSKVFNWEEDEKWNYKGELPAIVDFYAEWCGPCKRLGPLLEELAEKYEAKLAIYKVDTDKEPALAGAFGIQSVPTLLFVPKEGEPRLALGAPPQTELERAIVEVLGIA